MTTEILMWCALGWLIGDAIYVAFMIVRWPYDPMQPPVNDFALRGLAWPLWLVIGLALCVWFLIACIIDLITGQWRTWFNKEK
jgi:hypothetical protein